jgi:Fuc2NAc and GlcNAc transferase
MLILGLVGWLDDARGVRPSVRLATHIAVSAATVIALGGYPTLHLGSHDFSVGIGGGVLATIGIVWAINLFNFMDGIDGIAGSQAVLIFGASAWLLSARGSPGLSLLALIFAAASLGFLIWNWPPAKIFMGDVGSGSLGYLIAGVALASDRDRHVPLLVFSILGGVFVFDATVTLIRRFIRGKRPHEAHRDHAYQRMTRAWGRHLPVTLAAAAITLILTGLGALAVYNPALLPAAGITAFIILGILMIAVEYRAPMQ